MLGSVEDIARRVQGRVGGDGSVVVARVGGLGEVGADGLSFIRDAKQVGKWNEGGAGAALISEKTLAEDGVEAASGDGRALIVVEDADLALIELLAQMTPDPVRPEGIESGAHVHPSAAIGEGVRIAAGASVGAKSKIGDGTTLHAGARVGAGATLGRGCELFANAVVQDRCVLGDGVILHPCVVIGADGFGYRPSPDGRGLIKIPHAGHVEIGDGVEIGANSCVDRGKFGATKVGAGTKIDNLVQIGHNCEIGMCCVICGLCGLAGSVKLGNGVTLAGGVGIVDGLTIGDGATIGGRAGVMNNVPPGETWLGAPARPSREAFRIFSAASSGCSAA